MPPWGLKLLSSWTVMVPEVYHQICLLGLRQVCSLTNKNRMCVIVPPFILPSSLDPLVLGIASFMDMLRWV